MIINSAPSCFLVERLWQWAVPGNKTEWLCPYDGKSLRARLISGLFFSLSLLASAATGQEGSGSFPAPVVTGGEVKLIGAARAGE